MQVLLIVDKLGKVNDARIANEAQASQLRRAFILATRTAVMQWRVNPLQIQHEGHDANGSLVVNNAMRPFSLTCDFRFECRGGKATVTSHQAAGSRASMVPVMPASGMLRATRRLLTFAAWLLLAGCAMPAARTGASVGPNGTGDAAKPVAMQHYTLPMGDISSGGNVTERPLPAYPKSMLVSCPARFDVQVVMDVNRDGRVEHVVGEVVDATPDHGRVYFPSVHAAAMQWRFNPLRVTHWAADVEGNSHVVDGANEPFKRKYTFRFGCHAGEPVVGVVEDSAPHRP